MSDEEKQAIEKIRKEIDNLKISILGFERDINDKDWLEKVTRELKNDISAREILLNLIEKQSKEIEHQKEKRENQKKELAILNAKQIEFNKLVNTVNSYKGQFKRQQKEIEELKNADLTTVYLNGVYDGEKKAKDKIKVTIEELEKQDREDRMSHNYLVIPVLQSLLEKE